MEGRAEIFRDVLHSTQQTESITKGYLVTYPSTIPRPAMLSPFPVAPVALTGGLDLFLDLEKVGLIDSGRNCGLQ